MSQVVYVGGVKMTKAEYRQMRGEIKNPRRTRRRKIAKWPLTPVALAVHPDQIGEARERNKRLGVNVDYRPDGRPVVPDERAYSRLRKIEGVFNKDSYSGS